MLKMLCLLAVPCAAKPARAGSGPNRHISMQRGWCAVAVRPDSWRPSMSQKPATTMICVAATLGFSGLAHGQAAWCGTPAFPAQQFPVEDPARYVAAADLDGDGHQDMVVLAGAEVVVLVGQGDGTLTDGPSYELSIYPRSVAVDDLDGDGGLDLAVVGYNNSPPYHGSVSILLGNGDGMFAAPVVYQTGIQSLSVAISDLDGDGDGDLAVANPGTYPDLDGNVSVLLGSGDGTFAAAVTYPTGHASVAAWTTERISS